MERLTQVRRSFAAEVPKWKTEVHSWFSNPSFSEGCVVCGLSKVQARTLGFIQLENPSQILCKKCKREGVCLCDSTHCNRWTKDPHTIWHPSEGCSQQCEDQLWLPNDVEEKKAELRARCERRKEVSAKPEDGTLIPTEEPIWQWFEEEEPSGKKVFVHRLLNSEKSICEWRGQILIGFQAMQRAREIEQQENNAPVGGNSIDELFFGFCTKSSESTWNLE